MKYKDAIAQIVIVYHLDNASDVITVDLRHMDIKENV